MFCMEDITIAMAIRIFDTVLYKIFMNDKKLITDCSGAKSPGKLIW